MVDSIIILSYTSIIINLYLSVYYNGFVSICLGSLHGD